jgi:CBS domain-containing protein
MTPIKDLLTFSESLTVHDAVHLLLKFGVSGAPVVRDTTGELVGIVSSFDFLQQEAGEGTLLPPIQGTSTKSAVESYLTAAKKICAKKVGDLMTTNIRTMEANQSMRDAASLMSQQKLHRLPIVDDRGKLVGMLTSSDVMIDMVHIVKNLPPGKESIEILKDDTEINDKLQP